MHARFECTRGKHLGDVARLRMPRFWALAGADGGPRRASGEAAWLE